jgi:hypothetical protein
MDQDLGKYCMMGNVCAKVSLGGTTMNHLAKLKGKLNLIRDFKNIFLLVCTLRAMFFPPLHTPMKNIDN